RAPPARSSAPACRACCEAPRENRPMKIVIVGAGATGAFLGARMARGGVDVTLIARGAHLAAMRERGVEVREADGSFVAHPPCTDDLDVVASADSVILTLKARHLAEMAPRLGPRLGPDTAVVPARPPGGARPRTAPPGGPSRARAGRSRPPACAPWTRTGPSPVTSRPGA